MRLGIFGGTFNPIHLGHLLLAEGARETLRLDRVLFIPTHVPPHKRAADLLPSKERLRLVQLAIRGHPAFAASDLEVRRPGPSYTVDTVRLLRRRFPNAQLFLLMGADMLRVRWRGWSKLRRACTLAVARRPGGAPPRREAGIRWVPMPQVAIASSDIRARLRRGRSIHYLVPAAVERAIRRRRFYRPARRSKI